MSDYSAKEPLTQDNFFKKLSEAVGEPMDKKESNGISDDVAPLLTFINGRDFMKQEFPEQEWLCDSLIPSQGMVCLSGMPSSYKSWFGFYIALCVLRGQPILDKWGTSRGGVLFIDKENVERQIQERMKMLGAGDEMKDCYFTQGNFTTENLNSLASVVSFVKDKKIKLVIIDSLIRIHTRNENEAVEMNKVFERLAEIQHVGATVLYLHHLRKSTHQDTNPMDRLRGSVDISARLDSLLAVENENNFIKVIHGKSRYIQAVPSFLMQFSVDKKDLAHFDYVKELEEGQLEGIACEDEIRGMLRAGTITRESIVEQLRPRHAERSVDRALKALVISQDIVRNLDGKKAMYSLNPLRNFLKEKESEEKN